jgi:hypothetical protein
VLGGSANLTFNGTTINATAMTNFNGKTAGCFMYIGSLAIGTTNNPGDGQINATSNIIAYYSDDRLKTRLGTIENALEKVMQIRGVLFTRINNGESDAGVLAQELQAVIPELVRIDDEGFLSVSYGNIAGLLIEAIKELKHELDEVKKKLP